MPPSTKVSDRPIQQPHDPVQTSGLFEALPARAIRQWEPAGSSATGARLENLWSTTSRYSRKRSPTIEVQKLSILSRDSRMLAPEQKFSSKNRNPKAAARENCGGAGRQRRARHGGAPISQASPCGHEQPRGSVPVSQLAGPSAGFPSPARAETHSSWDTLKVAYTPRAGPHKCRGCAVGRCRRSALRRAPSPVVLLDNILEGPLCFSKGWSAQ